MCFHNQSNQSLPQHPKVTLALQGTKRNLFRSQYPRITLHVKNEPLIILAYVTVPKVNLIYATVPKVTLVCHDHELRDSGVSRLGYLLRVTMKCVTVVSADWAIY